MNTMFLAILMIAGSLFMAAENLITLSKQKEPSVSSKEINQAAEISAWEKNAIDWLIEAQAQDGGWGAGSHAFQNVRDPHLVKTDPATTAFAAMALLKAGGSLPDNPYREPILKALDKLIQNIEARPNNGRITPLEGTQPQTKLGIHIDASLALQFLTAISTQLTDKDLQKKADAAAQVCIGLIQNSQNANGGWAGGGWAPVLQSAMANNALEVAQARYEVDDKVIENSRKYQAENAGTDGSSYEDAAGVPLYAVASAQRATMTEAKQVDGLLPTTVKNNFEKGTIEEDVIVKELESTGISKQKAQQLAKSYMVNQASTKALQDEQIWEGFGNNGGEEYLSYLMTSEALAQQSKEDWLKWKQSIEPKFKQSQNPNGSWSGHHCITSPVFCTAAILQTLNVRT